MVAGLGVRKENGGVNRDKKGNGRGGKDIFERFNLK